MLISLLNRSALFCGSAGMLESIESPTTYCKISGMNNEIMKGTKVQNRQRNKCRAVVEKDCLVAEYHVPYRIRAAYHNYCC